MLRRFFWPMEPTPRPDCCEGVNQAYFIPKTLKWTNLTNTGKVDRFDEEGWGLLPNGDILTVDAINAPNSEVFNPDDEEVDQCRKHDCSPGRPGLPRSRTASIAA